MELVKNEIPEEYETKEKMWIYKEKPEVFKKFNQIEIFEEEKKIPIIKNEKIQKQKKNSPLELIIEYTSCNEIMKREIKEKLIEKDRNKFTLYEDLVNLCYEGGCLSSVGEDFDTLLHNYTNDEGKNNENALDKSPYMPTKCLSKTNGFLLNIRLASDKNEDITTLLKTHKVMQL